MSLRDSGSFLVASAVDFFVTIGTLVQRDDEDRQNRPIPAATHRLVQVMYSDYWRLTRDPFRGNGLDFPFFPGGDHEEALSRLLFVAEQHRRSAVIWGPSGVGKSRLLREVQRQLPRALLPVLRVDLTGLTRSEFVAAVGHACGFAPHAHIVPSQIWQEIEAWLHGRAALNRPVIWLLDEFDMSAESLELDMQRLMRLAEQVGVRSAVVVAMQRPGLAERLADQAEFLVELTAWDHANSCRFVCKALESVGGAPTIFTDDGLDALADAADGLPSRLLRIAEVALIAGSVLEAKHIDAEIIHAVTHQLGWSTRHKPLRSGLVTME